MCVLGSCLYAYIIGIRARIAMSICMRKGIRIGISIGIIGNATCIYGNLHNSAIKNFFYCENLLSEI